MSDYIDSSTFDNLVLHSLNNKRHVIPNTVYYDMEYYNCLYKELSKRDLISNYKREFRRYSHNRIKICSVASSARLCFLNFVYNNYTFEKDLIIQGVAGGIAHLDAFDNIDTYIECKCREITNKHTDKLSTAYESQLKECFNIVNIRNNINDKKIELFLPDFGIPREESIYNLSFDFKQLICHLLGLANNNGGKLQYIFFTPNNHLIELNKSCQKLYENLRSEITEIWNCPVIQTMCSKYKITLLQPIYIQISHVRDFVIEQLF